MYIVFWNKKLTLWRAGASLQAAHAYQKEKKLKRTD